MTHLSTLFLALLAIPTAANDDVPVLLDFHAEWCGPCREMRPAVETLRRKGYPIKSVDIDQDPDLAARYQIDSVPTFVVVDRQGRELDRISGARPALELAKMYNAAQEALADQVAADRPVVEVADAPAGDDGDLNAQDAEAPRRTLPKPWETVVRIRIFSSGSVGFGSGTIIRSTPDETIILTCAHIFKMDGVRQQPHPSRFPLKIQVDLFDGTLHGMRPAQVHPVESVRGQAIDYDFDADVGLIRIRPGRKLAASPVVPPNWVPRPNTPMITVGCSEGNDATAWSTHITNPKFGGMVGGRNYVAIECNHAPKQGRSGGGLYTTEGYLAGVCDFAAPQDRRGLYAHPSSIYRMLDKNSLAICYNPTAPSPEALLAARAAAARQGARHPPRWPSLATRTSRSSYEPRATAAVATPAA